MKSILFASFFFVVIFCGNSHADIPSPPRLGNPEQGKNLIRNFGCGSCHEIPGVQGADGTTAPSLRAFSKRSYVAGVVENSMDNLVHWIQNPPEVDHLTAMPNVGVKEPEAKDIASYLFTLK
jgi:cytochrome c